MPLRKRVTRGASMLLNIFERLIIRVIYSLFRSIIKNATFAFIFLHSFILAKRRTDLFVREMPDANDKITFGKLSGVRPSEIDEENRERIEVIQKEENESEKPPSPKEQIQGEIDAQGSLLPMHFIPPKYEPSIDSQITPNLKPLSSESPSLIVKSEETSRRIAPEKRGGRPRTPLRGEQSIAKSVFPPIRPEIVCWQQNRQWVMGIEVPEDIVEADPQILQNGAPLSQDDNGYWPLAQIDGNVLVRWKEGGEYKERTISLEEDHLIFKLSDQNRGRKVRFPSSGEYLVIVPSSWIRDNEISGPPPVTPQPVTIGGYQAHFFLLEKGGEAKIAFRLPDGQSVVIESRKNLFGFVGYQLSDASETLGPLFGRQPPEIRAVSAQRWNNVSAIVIGEEGPGRKRWRSVFYPQPGTIRQRLPDGIAERKAGWYFLRFYDQEGELIESLDFRFIAPLDSINISQTSPLPSLEGHGEAQIQFLCNAALDIQPLEHYPEIQIKKEDTRILVSIPPMADYDRTRWSVGVPNGPNVEVTMLLERIWWAIGSEYNIPSEWQDGVIPLRARDFRANSRQALWVKLPRPRWVDQVRVGFSESKARYYAVKVTEDTVVVPLRDFEVSPERNQLRLWVPDVIPNAECEVVRLVFRYVCKQCRYETDDKESAHQHVHQHLDALFGHLPYEELRSHDPSLPHRIFLCSYCNYYVRSDDPINPTSAITYHIEKQCPKVPRDKGPVPVRFRSIEKIDEIRRYVIPNLPRIYKCRFCGNKLYNPTDEERVKHLTEHHWHQLYRQE